MPLLFADVTVPQPVVNWIGGIAVAGIVGFTGWLFSVHRSLITMRVKADGHDSDIAKLVSAHDKHADMDVRMATVEEQTKTIFRQLEKMDSKLDKLIERK